MPSGYRCYLWNYAMPIQLFALLIAVVIALSALTVWIANFSVGWALMPALATVGLVLTVLTRLPR